MTVTEYQFALQGQFDRAFGLPTRIEWSSKMGADRYAPRLDLAIGPFAIEDGNQQTAEHLELFDIHELFFIQLAQCHLANLHNVDAISEQELQMMVDQKVDCLKRTNYNGRCFISVEIENLVSRKHLMGGAINACALGKIGIAVGFDQTKHRAFLNLYRYFQFLQNVGKPTFNTNNLVIVSKDQLLEIISAYQL